MIEFLKAYGVWILLGIFLLLLFVRGRGRAGGCCGGGSHQHDSVSQIQGEDKKKEQQKHSGCC